MAWKKGQSGNPGGENGRSKEDAEVKRLAREHTVEAVTKLVEWMRSDNSKASVSACNALLDRGYGKPSQAVDHTVTHGYDEALMRFLNGDSDEQPTGDDASVPATIQ